MITKTCGKCRQTKLLTDFHFDRSKKHGVDSRCKTCRLDPVAVRQNHIVAKYGITTYEWEAAFAMQNRRCAICRSSQPNTSIGWVTDHNHMTQQVRGILCSQCNILLGWVEGGWSIPGLTELESLRDYLRDPPFPRHMAMVYGHDDQQLGDQLA